MELKQFGLFLIGLIFSLNTLAQVTISASSDTVCNGGLVTLSSTQLPDSTTCIWQKSINSLNFTDITNSSNRQSYSLSILQPSTFRLKLISGEQISYSTNTVSVSVYAPIQAATITGADTICYETTPNALTIVSHPSGSSNLHSRWQQKTNNSQWVDVGTIDQPTFQPTVLTTTTAYRLKTYSLTCQDVAYSNTQNIVVLPNMYVSISADTSICYNESVLLRLSATGADNNYTYQWQSSTDNSSYTNLIGQENTTLSTNNLVGGQYYRCIVSSSRCSISKTTNSCHVSVYSQLQSPTISYSGEDTICNRTGSLTLSEASFFVTI